MRSEKQVLGGQTPDTRDNLLNVFQLSHRLKITSLKQTLYPKITLTLQQQKDIKPHFQMQISEINVMIPWGFAPSPTES